MKKAFSFFIVFFMLLTFYQCNKEDMTASQNISSVNKLHQTVPNTTSSINPGENLSEGNPCEPHYSCNNPLEDKGERVYTNADIPLLGNNCKLLATYEYKRCNNDFYFYGFSLDATSGCNLTDEERDALAQFLEPDMKRYVLKKYMLDNGIYTLTDVKTYQFACSRWCKEWIPIVIEDDNPGGMLIPGTSGGGVPLTDQYGYRWRRVKCGLGCCVTNANYSLVNGEAVLVSAETSSFGDCMTGPPPNWPYDLCAGILVGDCINECFYP